MNGIGVRLNRNSITIGIVAAVFVAISGIGLYRMVSAAGGSIYLSPSSKSVEKGSTVSFAVRVNPGGDIDTVNVKITYDSTKLQYISYSNSGSPFSILPATPNANSPVVITQAIIPGKVNTDALIGNITFKALTDSGNTSLSLNGSDSTNVGASTNPSTGSATVSFTSPPPSGGTGGGTGTTPKPPTGSTGSSGTSNSGSNSGNPSTQPGGSNTSTPAAKPTPVDVTNKQIQYSQAGISCTSSSPTKVYIKYGIGNNLITTTKTSEFAKQHTVSLDPAMLVPGQEYSYVIVSTNEQGATTTSKVQTFKTKGLVISVGVYDKNHKPIKNRTVTLHSDPSTATTDDNGIATFTDVSPGTHHVTYTVDNKEYSSEVVVSNNVKSTNGTQTADTQNLAVVYDFTQKSSWAPAPWTIGGLILIVVAAFGIIIYRKRRPFAYSGSTADADIVTSAKSTTTQPESSSPINKLNYPATPQPGSTVAPDDGQNKEEQPK